MKHFSKLTGIIVLLILVVLSLMDVASVDLASRWVAFFGRFHPVLLHVPIGLFAGVVLLELYVMVRPVSRVPEKIHFLLSATFYTTALTALLGIFLSWEGGYAADALNFHKWGGVVTTGMILMLDWALKGRRSRPEKLPTAYLAGLVVTIMVISVTGHLGGSLTHGSNFLTEFSPFGSKAEVAEVTADTPVFVAHIQPVLKDYCFQCHSEEKIKGELRLDSFEFIMAGGVNGPAIVPGDSESSKLLEVIHLPLEAKEHMPPKGKPQLSPDTINLLAWWIDQGASGTAKLDELNVTAEVAGHFREVDVLEFQPREEVDVQLEKFEDSGNLSVYYLAQDDSRLGARGSNAVDSDLVELLLLKANIVELNLAKSGVTDVGLEAIGQMTNLTHLHLNNTAITDAGLEHLANLYQLEYLNLYGTAITDAGLSNLRPLKNLKKVFLWETAVTKEAVSELHRSVFNAVASENLRLQLQELTKERDSLEVDIVSAFDFEGQSVEEVAVSEAEISISDVMLNFHKGKTSLAAQAQEGKADKEALQNMLKNYQAIVVLTPPKGTVEDWKKRTSELIEATDNLLKSGGAEAVERYKAAVNCKACHTEHRTD